MGQLMWIASLYIVELIVSVRLANDVYEKVSATQKLLLCLLFWKLYI